MEHTILRMKVEKSVELESYNCTNLRIKVWQSIDLDQSDTSIKTLWSSFATNVQNLLQRKSILWFITIQTVPHQTCQDTWQRKGLWGTQVLPWMLKIISCQKELDKTPENSPVFIFILQYLNVIISIFNLVTLTVTSVS